MILSHILYFSHILTLGKSHILLCPFQPWGGKNIIHPQCQDYVKHIVYIVHICLSNLFLILSMIFYFLQFDLFKCVLWKALLLIVFFEMFKWNVILTPEIYNYRDLSNLSFLKQICHFIRKPIEYANCLNPS